MSDNIKSISIKVSKETLTKLRILALQKDVPFMNLVLDILDRSVKGKKILNIEVDEEN